MWCQEPSNANRPAVQHKDSGLMLARCVCLSLSHFWYLHIKTTTKHLYVCIYIYWDLRFLYLFEIQVRFNWDSFEIWLIIIYIRSEQKVRIILDQSQLKWRSMSQSRSNSEVMGVGHFIFRSSNRSERYSIRVSWSEANPLPGSAGVRVKERLGMIVVL